MARPVLYLRFLLPLLCGVAMGQEVVPGQPASKAIQLDVVVAPKSHPLVGRAELTLDEIADYPIITYDQDFTGRSHIDSAFAKAGVAPDVVLTAIDADVIKTYVEIGMGIGIVAAMAIDPKKDSELVVLNTVELFEPNTTRVGLRKGAFLRQYAYRLIEMFAPQLTEAEIAAQLREPA